MGKTRKPPASTKAPKYLGLVAKHLQQHPMRPGSVVHVEVRHDEWCNLLNRRGPCNCNPVIGDSGEPQ